MTNQSLLGKSALVTGGARRVGRGIALALAEAGADVALTFRSSRAEAVQTASEIENLGRRALAVECDVRSEASVRAAVAAAVSSFGRLDLVVNNAAVFASAPLDSLTVDQWDAVFETNARGPFLVAREALPHLRAFKVGEGVNCVAPGWIALEAEEIERGTGQAAHFAAKTPMQCNGSVDDVAQAVLFFAAGPHFITGQVLAVDGGLGL